MILNVGDADTAYTGGDNWCDETIVAAIRKFIYNGGGFIGVGEPAAHQHEGHFFQLAAAMGVEKETGFTLTVDKYNWEQHDHFIKEDCTGEIDFGEGKKNIYALDGAQILVEREKEVQMAVNEFGEGRCVYISGLPYSFENSRILYRSIIWSSHDEENLYRWFSSNFNAVSYTHLDVYKRQVTQFLPVVRGKEDDGIVVNSLLLQRQNQPSYLVVQMGDARIVACLGLPYQLRIDRAGLRIIDSSVSL